MNIHLGLPPGWTYTLQIAAAPPAPSPQPAPPAPVPPAPAPGGAPVWQQLSFQSVLRRPVISGGGAGGGSYNPLPALTTEAAVPVASANIPFRGFCRAVMGEPGVLYYTGGLHSDYAGNEIDRIDLRDLASTSLTNSINHQPNQPPHGPDSGYGSGSGAYLYRAYDTGLANGADWQPYAHHTWCNNAWHPALGHLLYSVYAVGDGSLLGQSPDPVAVPGNNFVQSSYHYYTTPSDSRKKGWVAYDYATGRYKLRVAQPGTTQSLPPAGVSDYAAYLQGQLKFYCNSYVLSVYHIGIAGAVTLLDTKNIATISTGITNNYWPAGKDGNGLLALHMDAGKFLLYGPNGPLWGARATTLDRFNHDHQIYVYDAVAKTMVRVTIPPNVTDILTPYLPNGDLLVSFAVDRHSRTVYMGAIDGPRVGGRSIGNLLVWRADFDDLTKWTQVTFANAISISLNMATDREPFKVYNGHLYALSVNGQFIRMHRAKITPGEVAPMMTFTRHDYGAQDFTLGANGNPHTGRVLGAKHVNMAYRPVDGRYYSMAGDIISSFVQSTYTLSVSPDGSYTFAQELDELTPAPVGYVRPASPDDGAWAYCGAGNSNPALADKFIWARGGDGIGLRSNVFMQGAYANDAAALADRWVMSKFVIYDPTNKRFTDVDISTWPVSQGAGTRSHPATWPAAAARNGVFDRTTNCFFRFCADGLVRFDFNNNTIRIWTVAWWNHPTISGRRIRMDATMPAVGTAIEPDPDYPGLYYWDAGANRYRTMASFQWEHQALWLDEATGDLYVVAPGTGYLWKFQTRGAESTETDGTLTIPYGPVGQGMPLAGQYPGSWYTVGMSSYLVPFKGGLLWMQDTPNGNSGTARWAFWRRLGYMGAWTPITLPTDWACNTFAAKDQHDINNDEFIGVGAYGMVSVPSSAAKHFYSVRG
jgi:hypothetical protein